MTGRTFALVLLLVLPACTQSDHSDHSFPTANQPTEEEEESEAEAGEISMRQYLQLRAGMTHDEVVHILGRDGKATRKKRAQISTAIVIWKNERGSNLTVVFENDRLVSKSQMGLRGFR